MVGFARLHRINIVMESMTAISAKRWDRFVASFGLERNIEFCVGDIGPLGGIAEKKLASASPINIGTSEQQTALHGICWLGYAVSTALSMILATCICC